MESIPPFIVTNVVDKTWASYKVVGVEDNHVHLENNKGNCCIVRKSLLGKNWSASTESVFTGDVPVPRGALYDNPALPDFIMFRNDRKLSQSWPMFSPHAVIDCTADTVKLKDQRMRVFDVSRSLLSSSSISGVTADEATDFWPIPEVVYMHMPLSGTTCSGDHGFACYRCNEGGELMMCEGLGCNETVCAPCWNKVLSDTDAWYCPKCQPKGFPADCMQLSSAACNPANLANAKPANPAKTKRPRGRAPAHCIWSTTTGEWLDVRYASPEKLELEAKQSKATGETRKRPRGRAPAGKTWSDVAGDWVALAPKKSVSKRPRGRAPAGMVWCYDEGTWKPIAKRARASAGGSLSNSDVEIEVCDKTNTTAAERLITEACSVNIEPNDLRAEANDVRDDAEEARVEVEDVRDGAEEARVEAEKVRDGAENVRDGAEEARVEAEDVRDDARVEAEDVRDDAEEARVEAEDVRDDAEEARVEAEDVRDDAEEARVEAEDVRDDAEEARARFSGTVTQFWQDAPACSACCIGGSKNAFLINCAGCDNTICASCCVTYAEQPWSFSDHALSRWWCKTCATAVPDCTLPFASLLYAWVNSEDTNEVVKWAKEGGSFIVYTNLDLNSSICKQFGDMHGEDWIWLQRQLRMHGFGICGDADNADACKVVHGDDAFHCDAPGLLRDIKLVHAAPCLQANARNETFATASEALSFRANYEKAFGFDAWQAMKPRNWSVYEVHERMKEKVGTKVSVEFSRGSWWRMTIVLYDPDEHTFVAKGFDNGKEFTSVIGLDNADETKCSKHDPNNRIRITPFKYMD